MARISVKSTNSDSNSAVEASASFGVRIVREGALIGLAVVCLYLLLALFSYDGNDPGWSSTGSNSQIANAGGPTGAWLADVF